jgi:hypothetical protein
MLFSQFSFGQSMEKHQWENRLLLIFTEDKKSANYQKQITILENKIDELNERKLIVYSFTKNTFSLNFDTNWKKSVDLFSKFNPKKATFKVWLIGLDGGIKLEQQDILSVEKLISLIVGMPMRKLEIKNND